MYWGMYTGEVYCGRCTGGGVLGEVYLGRCTSALPVRVHTNCVVALPCRRLKHYTLTWSMHSLQSALHVVQVGLAYILMLLAMTYNGWLFLSVTVGAGIGYFAFARVRHLSSPFREQQDHCT